MTQSRPETALRETDMPDIGQLELLEMNRQLRDAWLADSSYTYDDFRRIFEEWLAQFAIPEGTRFEPVDAGGVPALWATSPDCDNSRVVVHFHSGGYLLGSAHGYRSFGGFLSRAADAKILLVDYRLAPDHPHPAAVEDALTTYRWLVSEGYSAERIALCGDSGGGGLALVALQQIRNANLPLPACTVSISPLADFTASGESRVTNMPIDPLVTADLLESMAQTYCGERDRTDPMLSPLFGDWAGLTPVLVLAGEIEAMRDDGKLCAAAAAKAGVDAAYIEGKDMVHIWPVYADRLPQAREALTQIGDFVRRNTGAA
jgi:monoterpene epsilon-lactone hydrolase